MTIETSSSSFCRGLLCLVVLVPWVEIRCQTTAVGARSISMAGISAVLEDPWAISNNPAGLARYDHVSAATSLEQRYFMKELGYYAIALTIPAGKSCLGVTGLFSGYLSYVDQKISLAYGRSFGENVLAGASLVYVFQKAGTEARPIHQVSYELGTIVVLSKKVNLAFAAFNPFQLYYKSEDYATLPAIIKLGLSYAYTPALIIYSECEKELDLPPTLRIGLEYIHRNIFFLRAGIHVLPARWSFGTGIRHRSFLLECSFYYHQYLGLTPGVAFQFDFK